MTPTQTRFLNMDHAELAEVAEGLVVALKDVSGDLRGWCGVVGRSNGVHSPKALACDARYRAARAALNRAEGR